MKHEKPICRLIYRAEGDVVNAYLADPFTMEGAVLLTSINAGLADSIPDLYREWEQLADGIVTRAIESRGLAVAQKIHSPVRDHERVRKPS